MRRTTIDLERGIGQRNRPPRPQPPAAPTAAAPPARRTCPACDGLGYLIDGDMHRGADCTYCSGKGTVSTTGDRPRGSR